MKFVFRIEEKLFKEIHGDLSRPHGFAHERVGFISCRHGALQNGTLLLAQGYHPVADEDYERSYKVGAMMGAAAIRKALQFAYNQPVTMRHIHRHEHIGQPRFSAIDMTENAKFIPDFWKVRSGMPHGAIVLSHDSMFGCCWNPITRRPEQISELIVVGRPLRIERY